MCHVLKEFLHAIIVELKDTFDPIAISCGSSLIECNGKHRSLSWKRIPKLFGSRKKTYLLYWYTLCWNVWICKCVCQIFFTPDLPDQTPHPSADTKIILRGSCRVQIARSCLKIIVCQLWTKRGRMKLGGVHLQRSTDTEAEEIFFGLIIQCILGFIFLGRSCVLF